MDIELDGNRIHSERAFHETLALALGVERGYGNNLDALWDLLSASVERPLQLTWNGHQVSREALGPRFQQIVDVLERVQRQDEAMALGERFSYCLR
ncbi:MULTISPECIES: barstar family protein [Stenotrophomonas]|jgi:ribonuclease inhibitor|uniref:barstar family protein n=1 Tax=Stenotrophomonas TaxID=40323 RepID=UPI00046FC043|nr:MULTISPECIES: barstar family protein [Stenotrophomonas]MDR6694453.1 ribonuclease inhibitor [Stenotrophomonas sp. 1337]OJH80069.1 MAG: barnase inhibitor [Stenotrophomonas maltophilia]